MNRSPAIPLSQPVSRAGTRALPVRLPLALALASFLSSLAFMAPPPLFPAMSRDLGVGIPMLGQLMTAMLLVGAVISLVTGPMADRHGLRRLLVIGAAAAALGLVGFGAAPTYLLLMLPAALGGLANATLPGLSLAVARLTLDGEARQRAIGWATAGGAGSAVIGVPLVSLVNEAAGWRAAFLAAGVAATAMAAFVASAIPRDMPNPEECAGPRTLLGAYAPLLRHHKTMRLYGVTILRSVAWFGLLGYFGAFLSERIGLDAAGIGLVYMLGGTAYVGGSLGAGVVLALVPPALAIRASNLAIALAIGLMFSLPIGAAHAAALLMLAGFAGALSWVATVTLLGTCSPAGTGTTMALNGALTNFGAAGGGALGGVLLATGGYTSLGIWLPLFAIGSTLILGRWQTSGATVPFPA